MTIILSDCDIFGCIPIFFELKYKNPNKNPDKNIILVNLSFTDEIGLKLLAKKK